MVVSHFYVGWTAVRPSEANTVLIVDTNAVLPLPVTAQWLQAITRWNAEVGDRRCTVQEKKLPRSDAPQLRGERLPGGLGVVAIEEVLGANIMKAANHADSLGACQ